MNEKYVFQQLAGHVRIDFCAAAQNIVQLVLPFKHQQYTSAALRHFGTGCHRFLNGLLDGRQRFLPDKHLLEPCAAADLFQSPPQLRLKQDDQRQNTPLDRMAQQEIDAPQVKNCGKPHNDQKHQHTLKNSHRRRRTHTDQDIIHNKSDDRHVDYIGHFDHHEIICDHFIGGGQKLHILIPQTSDCFPAILGLE